MTLHQEIKFESDICEAMQAKGWLYSQGDAAQYDREHALYLPDVLAWVETTQPDGFARLGKTHGADMPKRLADRLRKSLNERGTLDVLRRGVEMLGLTQQLELMQRKPALMSNPELLRKYAANRLRVVRQVHHSVNNANEAMDLVLFVNGIAVATLELKSDFTQSVDDAVDQYRFDRNPFPERGRVEPLLAFPSGALVHFAVSQSDVRMTTKLAGADTYFLPFNRGNDGGAGNAPNLEGYATSYLWDEVLAPEGFLEILSRYLIGKRDEKKKLASYIFPRYHQLDATRALLADVLHKHEAGEHNGRYLIQHSAGSGKTNSIAWTAHFLADLHGADEQKVFDSVLVVSDRTVLDSQLSEAIFDFERTTGVVESISNERGSKSKQLGQALKDGKKIIVCTIQTFPFALAAVQELSATQGKRFVVIADEAHSSQSGEAAAKLKQILSAEEFKELQDGGEIGTEDILAANVAARASQDKGLTYIAFTATPKGKTLELFGQKNADGKPEPFHVYTMRQAIEEGFILDVLRNYTSYKLAFKLAHNGQEIDEKSVERSEAMKGIMQWVRLHPYNIAQKVEVVVEHYLDNVQPLLDGKAKAMIVVSSRKEAVRWQKAIRAYIERRNYKLGVLVAFSGEIEDVESFPEAVSESSKELNPLLNGKDIREAFKGEDYHLLLVANKFQTGFDQPLLCGMYIDKMLGGIQAVQTLSRLNRAHKGKDTTYILDFVNDSAQVLNAFKTYYETATMEATTDPDLVFNLRAKLDAAGHYDDFEVNRVAEIAVKVNAKQSQLSAVIAPVADRLLKRYRVAKTDWLLALESKDDTSIQRTKDVLSALLLFKGDMEGFIRLYAFLSQIFDYGNTDIEKRFIFYKLLTPLLDFGREREQVDLSKVQLTHHSLRNKGKQNLDLGKGETPTIPPIDGIGTGGVQEKDKALLEEIINKVNGLFEGELSPNDQLVYVNGVIKGKLLENETLVEQAQNNSKEQFSNSPDLRKALMDAVIDSETSHRLMSTQAINSDRVREGILDALLQSGQLYELLRGQQMRNNQEAQQP